MPRSSGLGKGLSSIIPAAELSRQANQSGEEDTAPFLADIDVAAIRPNPNQPRVHFDEQSLLELSSSIAEMGVLQPVLVRPVEGGGFELVAGERRWRAAQRAGMATIPAIVRTADDLRSIEQALVENLHRQDLTPLEEAAAYQQLIEDFQLTHEQLSSRVGKSRSAITNTLRLLGLPPAVQRLLADGQLSAGHARALLGTPDRELQERLARQAVDSGWSVRAIEQAVREGVIEPSVDSGPEPDHATSPGLSTGTSIDGAGLTPHTTLRPPGLLELEGLLADHLDTRVAVQMSARRGKVTIDFADLEDLERIFHRMVP
jgi:ParB family chromosome partitioning protein